MHMSCWGTEYSNLKKIFKDDVKKNNKYGGLDETSEEKNKEKCIYFFPRDETEQTAAQI